MSTTQIIAEPGSHEVSMTREFAAPPALLYRAFTEPELLVQWLGPRRLTMKIESNDVRFGGTWRFVHITPEGFEHWFRGVFCNDPSVENGLVRTFEYEGVPGHVCLETLHFEPSANGTLTVASSVFQSVADRDAHIASGMETGVVEGNERLDELIARLTS